MLVLWFKPLRALLEHYSECIKVGFLQCLKTNGTTLKHLFGNRHSDVEHCMHSVESCSTILSVYKLEKWAKTIKQSKN